MRPSCCPPGSCAVPHPPSRSSRLSPGGMVSGWGCSGWGHCLSPAGSRPPLGLATGATRTVRLQLLSKETGVRFAGADFVFYNCSVLQS